MVNYKKVSKEELARLIRDSYRLAALKNGGVDNWEQYSESIIEDESIEMSDDELTEKYENC